MKPSSQSLTAGQQLAQELATNVTDARLAEAISEALVATQTTRSGTVEPDHRTRLQAATLALAYKHGRPVDRSEVVSVNLDADSSIGLAERLANSPALLKSLKAVIAKVENEGLLSRK
jgi:hypothetical protein